jgi:hypothetical protein
VGRHILIQDDNQTETVGHVLGFDMRESPMWAIQRPDGQYWIGSTRGTLAPAPIFGLHNPLTFISPESAQMYIDAMQRSTLKRAAFRDCTPVRFPLPLVEPGEHIVCACGQFHERDYCPAADGHGVIL